MKLLDLYDVDLKYIRDLHNSDSNVMSQSPQVNKDTRRYLGIIIMLNGQQYCIPFSSGTKEKFQRKNSNVDLLKIPDFEHKDNNGAYKTLAVLNINNMIPVSDSVISKVDLRILKSDNTSQRQRKGLLQKELKWCRDNCDLIERRAQKVYSLVVDTPNKNKNLTRRCCDFKKLEAVLQKYMMKQHESKEITPVSSSKKKEVRISMDTFKKFQANQDARNQKQSEERSKNIGQKKKKGNKSL